MTVLMLVGLFGGLGMFIYGMHLMSEGLKIVAGSKMKQLLDILTNTPIKALLCGIIVTILVQSSSATTVMVVGFVNASLMNLQQAAGIILGSDIGTTLMAQIIAFNITAYSPVFIGIGTFMALFSKSKKVKDWGSIVLGFGILFFGISTMSTSVGSLNDSPEFVNLLLTYGKNPILGLLASTVMTGILQSSGAIIGLIQALAISGVFSTTSGTEAIEICIPLIIGSNIGTCITAILSSIGTSNTAKDAAIIHLFVKIFGAIWVMILLAVLNAIFPVDPIYSFIVNISGSTTLNGQIVPNVARQIAMAHTIFNIANTLVLLPFINVIVKVVEKILPPEKNEDVLHLDTRLLNTPGIALGQANEELIKMSIMTAKNFGRAMDMLITLDESKYEKIDRVENRIDEFEQGIQNFVVSISNLNMSEHENERVAFIIENAHTIERIADHAHNLANLALDMIDHSYEFSPTMVSALLEIKERIGKMLDRVTEVLKNPNDNEDVEKIFRDEDVIDRVTAELKEKRIRKVDRSKKVYPTFVFVDILTNVERVSDLAEDVAIASIHLNVGRQINGLNEVVY